MNIKFKDDITKRDTLHFAGLVAFLLVWLGFMYLLYFR